MADKVIYWSKTALTGGAAGALDSIDGTALQDGEVAHVWISNVLYIYRLDADSAAAESSPAIIAPDTNAGDKRWILQSYYSGPGTLYTDHIAESTAAHGVEIDGLTIKDSGFALGSDADGDMYYRASSALARLGKGTANYKLFMNAAGTAPEWAKGHKAASMIRAMDAASGDVSESGIGFKPSLLLIWAGNGDAASTIMSIGYIADDGTGRCIYMLPSGQWIGGGTDAIVLYEGAGKQQTAVWKSWDTNGFTLTWTRIGETAAANVYLRIVAFR